MERAFGPEHVRTRHVAERVRAIESSLDRSP
jgi:hypothetical protein